MSKQAPKEAPKQATLLEDYMDLEPFAAEMGRDPRSVRRWMEKPDGLPYTRIGSRILVHLPTARAWIFAQMRHPAPRRKAAEALSRK
jgi:hypothetical protein